VGIVDNSTREKTRRRGRKGGREGRKEIFVAGTEEGGAASREEGE